MLEGLISLHGVIENTTIRQRSNKVRDALITEHGIHSRFLSLFNDALYDAAIPENIVRMTSLAAMATHLLPRLIESNLRKPCYMGMPHFHK